jgi:hypothetical protein
VTARDAHTRHDPRALAARLAHDIGKYVARGACNVRDGEVIAEPVARLMTRDLYELAPGCRASRRFTELAAGLRGAGEDARFARCDRLFERIDALEPAVRAGDERALRGAAALALEIRTLLEALAGELGAGDR